MASQIKTIRGSGGRCAKGGARRRSAGEICFGAPFACSVPFRCDRRPDSIGSDRIGEQIAPLRFAPSLFRPTANKGAKHSAGAARREKATRRRRSSGGRFSSWAPANYASISQAAKMHAISLAAWGHLLALNVAPSWRRQDLLGACSLPCSPRSFRRLTRGETSAPAAETADLITVKLFLLVPLSLCRRRRCLVCGLASPLESSRVHSSCLGRCARHPARRLAD